MSAWIRRSGYAPTPPSSRWAGPSPTGSSRTSMAEPDSLLNAPLPPITIHRARTDTVVGALAGEAIAVLGYGNRGRSAALNLRDSGLKVRVGNRGDAYADRARAEGFDVVPVGTAAADDIVFALLPDEVIPEVFSREVAPSLRPGS